MKTWPEALSICRAWRGALASLQLFAALTFAATWGAAQQKDDLPHPKTVEELKKAMKDVLDKEHVPGAGVALIANGELLWCGGIGKADIAANRDVTCDTEFRVGSVSKTFVALALLKLAPRRACASGGACIILREPRWHSCPRATSSGDDL